MNQSEARDCVLHLWRLFPRAEERWPKERQQAFMDQLRRCRVSVAQFRAMANDVAMHAKSTWCPPESEILKRLERLIRDENSGRATSLLDAYRSRQVKAGFHARNDCDVVRAESLREIDYYLRDARSEEHRLHMLRETEIDVRRKCEALGVEYVPVEPWLSVGKSVSSSSCASPDPALPSPTSAP